MTKEEKKKEFRSQCIQALKHRSKKQNYAKDKTLVDVLYAYIKEHEAQSIMLYLPLKIEVNLYPLIYRLRREKKQLYVPFMEGNSFRLVKYRLPLQKKRFGIKEPKDSKQYKAKRIDMAIVPIVGLDITLRRVGFGKGMYDRFFEKNSKNIKHTVFVARELCLTKAFITDDYDVQADRIFTP
ncbi:5-formyltetrahydrofolate cyclo-ligase [hydrothermal vent metagenome]|uniref:5-formyltetrahydrofolate cyclo-ligase n=1 Tax=hydrothermal vent metagenome TaxID=652676 RepID=A0A1W1CHY3_9ZZZZ